MIDILKVSVVIPVYNTAPYLEEAISSIQNQTLREIEIIVVNDGSTDDSLRIIQRLAAGDERIRVISTPNNGQSIARNIGISCAKGEYVYFFDSDDMLSHHALEECYTKSTKHELDLLFFDAVSFSTDGRRCDNQQYIRCGLYIDKIYSGTEMLSLQMSTGGYKASPCLSFINRDFMRKNQLFFYPGIVHEDELFTFLLYLRAVRVGLINETYFQRRYRAMSTMTSPYSIQRALGMITVVRELFSYARRSDITGEARILLKRHANQLIYIPYYSSKQHLSREDFLWVEHVVKVELFKELHWRLKLRLRFPKLFVILHKVKTVFIM